MSCNSIVRRAVVLSALGLAMHSELNAQQIVPSVEWERLYADEACFFDQLIEAPNAGYVLGGMVYESWDGDRKRDYSLIKIDGEGSVQWARMYGGTGDEGFGSLQKTSDGGYIFATASTSPPSGSKESSHFGMTDVWVVKLDSEGRKQWERSIGGSGDDAPVGIHQMGEGDYLIAAALSDALAGEYLIKLNAQGETQWQRPLNTNWFIHPRSFTRGVDGDFFLSGVATTNGPYGGLDGWVSKVDADANKQWERFFGGTGRDDFNTSDNTADGGMILGGSSSSPPSGNKESPHFNLYDYWLVKVDAAGEKQWDRSYSRPAIGFTETAHVVRQTSDHGFIFGGNSQIIKVDSNGQPEWEKAFFPYVNGDIVDIRDLQQTKDGGYLLAGNLFFGDGSSGEPCHTGGWAAKLERVVSNAGEVITWTTRAGLVLESLETLNGEWSISQTEALSIGNSSAIPLVPAGQQRYYRLRAPEGAIDHPTLSFGALLSWPVGQTQALEISASKDGGWVEFSGDRGLAGEANYAIVPQNLKQHYFRTRKRQ
jgi:hypothetical protein